MKYLRRQLEDVTTLYAPESHFTRAAVDSLSSYLMCCGQSVEAEVLLRPYVTYPLEDNDWSAGGQMILARYAKVLDELDKNAEAETLLRHGIRSGNVHSFPTYPLKYTLGHVLWKQGKLHECRELLSALFSEAKREFGPDHGETMMVAQLLVATIQRLAQTPTTSG